MFFGHFLSAFSFGFLSLYILTARQNESETAELVDYQRGRHYCRH